MSWRFCAKPARSGFQGRNQFVPIRLPDMGFLPSIVNTRISLHTSPSSTGVRRTDLVLTDKDLTSAYMYACTRSTVLFAWIFSRTHFLSPLGAIKHFAESDANLQHCGRCKSRTCTCARERYVVIHNSPVGTKGTRIVTFCQSALHLPKYGELPEISAYLRHRATCLLHCPIQDVFHYLN